MVAIGGRKVESVLIVRSAFGEIHELAWLRALRDLGIRAELFDTHSYIPRNLVGRLEQRLLIGPHIGKVNRMVAERVKKMRPDAVHFYQGHHYTAKTIAQVARISFTSGLHNDDPFGRPDLREYRLLIKALPTYDGYHVNRRVMLPRLAPSESNAYVTSSWCITFHGFTTHVRLSRTGSGDLGFGCCFRGAHGAGSSHRLPDESGAQSE